MYERSGLKQDLLDSELPEGGSNRSYKAIDILESFMVGTILGSRRMAHTSLLRHDEVVKEIFGWSKGVASQSTMSRFFSCFTQEQVDTIFTDLMRKWWSRMEIQGMTIDFDSTVITRYGQQEGAKVGYNPTKQGRNSHHPLMAFFDELKMVISGWMRAGNTSDSAMTESFIDHVLSIVDSKKLG